MSDYAKRAASSSAKQWPGQRQTDDENNRIGRPSGEVVQTEPPGHEHHARGVHLNYSCFEMKRLSEPEPRRQQELEECRGELLRVHEAEGFCVAIFAWGAVSLPGELVGRLRELVGRKIGILRLDGYHIREV